MKISKLFHWLYAVVMLLPVFAIGVTCLISTFNKNVGITGNEQQETLVTSFNELQNPNETFIFKLKYHQENERETIDTFMHDIHYISGSLNQTQIESLENTTYIRLWFDTGLNSNYITWPGLNTNLGISQTSGTSLKFSFKYDNTNNPSNRDFSFIYDSEIYKINIVDLDTINVFYYSVDKVTESPLFSWAYDSFLVAPFSYIVALFGMPTNHVVVQLLSYWLAISIIWLVFDLIMYVPLLVHRWLDKGVLE